MPKPKYQCTFQNDWLNPQLFSGWNTWLHPVSNDIHRAFCSFCKKSFDIGNMGKAAIRSHESRPTHANNKVSSTHKTSGIEKFLINSTKDETSALSIIPGASTSTSIATTSSVIASTSMAISSMGSCSKSTLSIESQKKMTSYVMKHETCQAEIIWALDSIKKHRSFHSSNDQGQIFRAMFPDSTIAQQYQMAEDKLAYITTFGLSPHFQKETLARICSANEFSISFDEAHNTIIQKGQLDLWVRYFNDSTGHVCSEYLTSVFLGHSKAVNLVESVTAAVSGCGSGLDMKKLIQISMDGPNVNLSFYNLFVDDYDHKFGKSILNTGVCSLHVVSGALQQGHRKTSWNLDGFLRGMFQIWKDSPARRADYIAITGSNLFPRPFCKTRWIENITCCERALEIFPHVKKYCNEIKPKPVIQSFATVEKATQDTLLQAQIEFFKTIASDFEPFLRRFQNDKPLIPFLHSFLLSLLHDCLKRIILPNVLDGFGSDFSKMKKVNLTNNSEHLKLATNVDIGFGAKRAIPSLVGPREKLAFYTGCKSFLVAVCEKLFSRCPLNYSVIRGASSLSPMIILEKSLSVCEKRFDVLLENFLDVKHISTSHADLAKQEYLHFISDSAIRNKLKKFSLDDDRLDDLYVEVIKSNKLYLNLWTIVRKVLVLFHGQANVESGFSINKDILVENLHESSVIAQRVVYNAIQFHGGVLSVPITEKLIQSVHASSSRRKLALSAAHEKSLEKEQCKKRKASLLAEINSINTEKAKLAEQVHDLDERAANINKQMKYSLC